MHICLKPSGDFEAVAVVQRHLIVLVVRLES